MFLSRIKLDVKKTDTMKALVSPNLFHGAIESAETDGRSRKLWRIDTLGGEKYLLILSEKKLDFSDTALQFGNSAEYESRNYDGLLERIENESRWRFRLKANPTVQKFNNEKGRGKVKAHITPEFQGEWLKKQSLKYGFSISEDEFLVTGSQWYIFRKGSAGNRVKILAVTYDGILTVTDKELFKNALTGGIGREKAYGLGMITVMGIY